jgi:hypothetical protein
MTLNNENSLIASGTIHEIAEEIEVAEIAQ